MTHTTDTAIPIPRRAYGMEWVTLHVYAISPIDFWQGWTPEHQYRLLLKQNAPSAVWGEQRLDDLIREAQRLARQIGWEGDVSQGPFLAPLAPRDSGEEYDYMIAWKQSNNGDTFIASPYRLSWLEETVEPAYRKCSMVLAAKR